MSILDDILKKVKRNTLDKTDLDEKVVSAVRGIPQKVGDYFNPTTTQTIKSPVPGGDITRPSNFWTTPAAQKLADIQAHPTTQFVAGAIDAFWNRIVRPYVSLLGEAGYQGGRYLFDPTFRKVVQGKPLTQEELDKLNQGRDSLFLKPQQIKSRKETAKTGTAATVKALLATYGLGGGTASALTTAALAGGLGYGAAKLSGSDRPWYEAGQAAGYSPVYTGINRLTGGPQEAITKKVLGEGANWLKRGFLKGGIVGTGNILEDLVFTPLTELRKPTKNELIVSGGTGILMSVGGEALGAVRSKVASILKKGKPDLSDAQAKAEADKYLRDRLGRFMSPRQPTVYISGPDRPATPTKGKLVQTDPDHWKLVDRELGMPEGGYRLEDLPMGLRIRPITPEERAKLPKSGGEIPAEQMELPEMPLRKVTVRPTSKTLESILARSRKAKEAAAKAEYNEWQRQVFKQENAQTTSQAIKKISQGFGKSHSPLSANVEELKDISGASGGLRDVYRNFKAVFGNRFEQAKRIILDPFNKSKGDFIDEQERLIGELKANVVDRFGIKKGSRESAAIQEFGEKTRDYGSLVQEFGEQKANQIVEADRWFRATYDRLLNEVNEVRARIYPNDPSKIIPRRQDYYRHFRELAEGIRGLANIFETPAGISPKLSGVSEFTEPKSKWLSFAQKRLGLRTEVDAVGGFLDYIKAAAYAKHIDPHISRFRALEEELAEATAEGPNAGKLNNFIEFLQDFANDLAGKTNPLDRTVQKWIPGGRKTLRALNWLNSRAKANVILGNLSSSLAQIFNVPQGIADAGLRASAQAMGDTLASIFSENTPMKQSTFLKERYFKGYQQFDTGLLDDAKRFAVWMMGALDEVGTKFIWNAEYRRALREGIPDAINFADDATRRLVAGRGIGEVPLAQKAIVFQLVAPFQLEVANLWWIMKDWVDEKAFGKLATFAVANYLFNRAAEAIKGSDVSFDPINATLEALETYGEEEDKKKGLLMAGGRLAGEVLANVPGGQTLAAMYPEYGLKVGETQLPTRRELFGQGDPTRFGSGLLVAKSLQEPLYKLLPPFGGQQLKKTIEGIRAAGKGYSESRTGLVRYPIEQSPQRFAQAALFGQYAVPEARAYFERGTTPLGENQSQLLKLTEQKDRGKLYGVLMNTREENAAVEKAKKSLEGGKESKQGEPATYTIDGKEVSGVVIGKKFVYLNEETGEASSKSIASIEKAQRAEEKGVVDATYSITADRLKRADDYQGWVKATETYIDYVKQYKDQLNPQTDKKEILSLQNKIEDLEAQVEKYKGYGGFTKGKQGTTLASILKAAREDLADYYKVRQSLAEVSDRPTALKAVLAVHKARKPRRTTIEEILRKRRAESFNQLVPYRR